MIEPYNEVTDQFREQAADQLNRFLWEQVKSQSHYRTIQEFNGQNNFGAMLVEHFSTSLDHNSPSLFADYLSWFSTVLRTRELPEYYLDGLLDKFQELIEGDLSKERRSKFSKHFNEALTSWKQRGIEPHSFIDSGNRLGALAGHYLSAVLNANRNEARKLIMEAVEESDTSVKDIYIHVFQAAQYEIGRLWQFNEISVAQEHYSTAVTQMIMSQLYPHIFGNGKKGKRMVAACVGRELHEIGIRMVADFFEMEGWDTYYLGANVPGEDLMQELDDKNPHVLSLSVTMTVNLTLLEDIIEKIRKKSEYDDLKILVGGYPFQVSRALWKDMGADGFAQDAGKAIGIAEELTPNS